MEPDLIPHKTTGAGGVSYMYQNDFSKNACIKVCLQILHMYHKIF